ncbi:MAG: ABC transporter permease subunit [bacterium]|nr:ABC transporter permease subunit [bacterium]
MKALLWKDCRVNQFVLIVGTVIFFLPYFIGLIGGIFSQWYWDYDSVRGLGHLSLLLSLVTITMLGGNAMAAERADRSAEFLAYLPPSRRSLIASKIILAVGGSLFVWIVNLVTILVLAPRLRGAPPLDGALTEAPGDRLLVVVVTAVVLFGVAWLLSSFVASPAIATGGGFLAPAVVAGALMTVKYFYLQPFPFWSWYNTLGLTVGILGFVAGTVCYLRRFEP